MDNRARAFRATLIKLGSFAIVMVLVFITLVLVFSNYRSGGSGDYRAEFTSASQIKSGSKVKIAGVEVGTVDGVDLTRDNTAEVRFSVADQYPLPQSVRALIRYENLTGDRYLELQQGSGDPTQLLATGDTIPLSQTEPALDLDKLLGGFKPLFRTLDPGEVNSLSNSLVAVFQGQGESLSTLLADTASFTDSLADRDQLIGSVITNLNDLLGTLDTDRRGLDTSIDQLQMLVTGLAAQRGTIGTSLAETAQVTNRLAGLLQTTRPDLRDTVASIGDASGEVLHAEPFLRSLLQRLPDDYLKLSNLGSYGSWLQIYFCRIRLLLSGPGGQQYYFTSNDVMGDNTRAGGRCARQS
ncbi:MAG: MCE family protein [Gordonia sp. (in: high G+C Gram-positive bacteria)]